MTVATDNLRQEGLHATTLTVMTGYNPNNGDRYYTTYSCHKYYDAVMSGVYDTPTLINCLVNDFNYCLSGVRMYLDGAPGGGAIHVSTIYGLLKCPESYDLFYGDYKATGDNIKYGYRIDQWNWSNSIMGLLGLSEDDFRLLCAAWGVAAQVERARKQAKFQRYSNPRYATVPRMAAFTGRKARFVTYQVRYQPSEKFSNAGLLRG